MMNVQSGRGAALVGKNGIPDRVSVLHTTTASRRTLEKILASVLQEHPQFFLSVWTLAGYAVGRWADCLRVIEEDGQYDAGAWNMKKQFGMDEDTFRKNCVRSGEISVRITEYMNKVIPKYPLLYAIHGTDTSKKIYHAKVMAGYRNEVLAFCEASQKDLCRLYGGYLKFSSRWKREIVFSEENTSTLLEWIRSFSGEGELMPVMTLLQKGVQALPQISDEVTAMSMQMYMTGLNEATITAMIGRSRPYVHARKTEGISILSFLIWGYASRDVLEYLNHP